MLSPFPSLCRQLFAAERPSVLPHCALADYTNLNDDEFDRQLSLREAYFVMAQYVADHFGRGELMTGDLLAHLALMEDGGSFDPATLDDFLIAARKVLDEGERGPITVR